MPTYDITVTGWVTAPAGLAPAVQIIETKMAFAPLTEVSADARREADNPDGDEATWEVTLWALTHGDAGQVKAAAEAAAMRLKALARATAVTWVYRPAETLEAF